MAFFEDLFIKCIVCNELDRKLKIHDGHHYVCLSCIRKMYQSIPLRCPLCNYATTMSEQIIENDVSNDIILRIDALVVVGAKEKAEKEKLMRKADLLLRKIELLESKKREFSDASNVDRPVDRLIDHPEDRSEDHRINCPVDFADDHTVNRIEDRPKGRPKDHRSKDRPEFPKDCSIGCLVDRLRSSKDLSADRPDILMDNMNPVDVPASCPTPAPSFSSKKSTIKDANNCSKCGKEFRSPIELERHQSAVHVGERPFQCQVCEKSFGRKYNLKRHLQIHSSEKPFQCQVCKKSFSFANNLKRHSRIHSGEKPFRCQVCNKSFNTSYHLKRHMRTHSGSRRLRGPSPRETPSSGT